MISFAINIDFGIKFFLNISIYYDQKNKQNSTTRPKPLCTYVFSNVDEDRFINESTAGGMSINDTILHVLGSYIFVIRFISILNKYTQIGNGVSQSTYSLG